MPVIDLLSDVTGTVWRIVASAGQELAQDEPLLIVESMKMEVPVGAPEDGRLVEILVEESQMVREGDVIARFEIP